MKRIHQQLSSILIRVRNGTQQREQGKQTTIQTLSSFKQQQLRYTKTQLEQFFEYTSQQLIRLAVHYESKMQSQAVSYEEQIHEMKQEIERQYKIIGLMKLQLEELVVMVNQRARENEQRREQSGQWRHQPRQTSSNDNTGEDQTDQDNREHQRQMRQAQQSNRQTRIRRSNNQFQCQQQSNHIKNNYSPSQQNQKNSQNYHAHYSHHQMPTISGLEIITQQETERTLVSVCEYQEQLEEKENSQQGYESQQDQHRQVQDRSQTRIIQALGDTQECLSLNKQIQQQPEDDQKQSQSHQPDQNKGHSSSSYCRDNVMAEDHQYNQCQTQSVRTNYPCVQPNHQPINSSHSNLSQRSGTQFDSHAKFYEQKQRQDKETANDSHQTSHNHNHQIVNKKRMLVYNQSYMKEKQQQQQAYPQLQYPNRDKENKNDNNKHTSQQSHQNRGVFEYKGQDQEQVTGQEHTNSKMLHKDKEIGRNIKPRQENFLSLSYQNQRYHQHYSFSQQDQMKYQNQRQYQQQSFYQQEQKDQQQIDIRQPVAHKKNQKLIKYYPPVMATDKHQARTSNKMKSFVQNPFAKRKQSSSMMIKQGLSEQSQRNLKTKQKHQGRQEHRCKQVHQTDQQLELEGNVHIISKQEQARWDDKSKQMKGRLFLQQFKKSFVQSYYQAIQQGHQQNNSDKNNVMSILQMIATKNQHSNRQRHSNNASTVVTSLNRLSSSSRSQSNSMQNEEKKGESYNQPKTNYLIQEKRVKYHQTETPQLKSDSQEEQGHQKYVMSMIRMDSEQNCTQDINRTNPFDQNQNQNQNYEQKCLSLQNQLFTSSNDCRDNSQYDFKCNNGERQLKSLQTTFGRPSSSSQYLVMRQSLSSVSKSNRAKNLEHLVQRGRSRKGSMKVVGSTCKTNNSTLLGKKSQPVANKQNQRLIKTSCTSSSGVIPSSHNGLIHKEQILGRKQMARTADNKPTPQQCIQAMLQSRLQTSNKFLVGCKKQQVKYDGQRMSHPSSSHSSIRHGHGLLYYSNGLIYDGQFYNNKRSGFGILRFNHVELYTGEWSQDQLGGQGKIRNCAIINKRKKQLGEGGTAYNNTPNTTINSNMFVKWISYCGGFKTNRFEGEGTLYLQGGQKFVGKFKNGTAEGQGSLFKKNGQVQNGVWKNNILIERLQNQWV